MLHGAASLVGKRWNFYVTIVALWKPLQKAYPKTLQWCTFWGVSGFLQVLLISTPQHHIFRKFKKCSRPAVKKPAKAIPHLTSTSMSCTDTNSTTSEMGCVSETAWLDIHWAPPPLQTNYPHTPINLPAVLWIGHICFIPITHLSCLGKISL